MIFFKKIFIILLAMFISLSIMSPKVFAQGIGNNQDTGYYDENGNYYNPETGEYFIWEQNSRSTAKVFSFKIRYSVTSNTFRLNSSTVRIRVYRATFVKENNTPASCCNSHQFQVDLRREAILDTHNIATFYAPFISTQTWNLGGGFYTSENYYVQIGNIDNLPSDVYLAGSGEVYCS
ncbi:hypothetical protein H6A03_05610 [[Clostridium] spiroforme]|nr:hypothetical protein [Thomasclavelia spiroformis]MBM6879979.1 hypothetical protein [Thomasclavelia spiroformis]